MTVIKLNNTTRNNIRDVADNILGTNRPEISLGLSSQGLINWALENCPATVLRQILVNAERKK